MKWSFHSSSPDFSAFELIGENSHKIVCKFNSNEGILRLRFDGHYSVFMFENTQLINRKFSITNVYGSEVGTVTRNLWHENTGIISLNHSLPHKLTYKINVFSSSIEVSEKGVKSICELHSLPDVGRELHFIPVLIALAWTQIINSNFKLEIAA